MIDCKINADRDVIVLKVRSEWGGIAEESTAVLLPANIPVRVTSSTIITSDGSQRWNEYFSETRAAATRDQFCSKKIHSPENALYLSTSRTNQ